MGFKDKELTFSSEPEFRLVFMSLSGIACALGMFLWGYATSVGASAYLCSFLQGVMLVGVVIGIFSTISYGLDAFRNLSSEMFIMNMLFKVSLSPLNLAVLLWVPLKKNQLRTKLITTFQNFVFYGLSVSANDWVASAGPQQMMYVFGGTSLFLALLAVPVYVFGKRLRSWWTRHDVFARLGMQKTGLVIEMA